MQRYLNICEEIEQLISKTYRHWQQMFEDDPGLSALWGKLAEDEMDHVRQVQLAKRVANEKVLQESDVSLEALTKSLAKARQLYKDVQVKTVTGEQALRAAIRIEEEFSKAHLLNATTVVDESIKTMFKSLARADELHVETIRNYCDSVLGNK
jgi:rubrerythrin